MHTYMHVSWSPSTERSPADCMPWTLHSLSALCFTIAIFFFSEWKNFSTLTIIFFSLHYSGTETWISSLIRAAIHARSPSRMSVFLPKGLCVYASICAWQFSPRELPMVRDVIFVVQMNIEAISLGNEEQMMGRSSSRWKRLNCLSLLSSKGLSWQSLPHLSLGTDMRTIGWH